MPELAEAEFLAPAIRISPVSGTPPCISSLSNIVSLQLGIMPASYWPVFMLSAT